MPKKNWVKDTPSKETQNMCIFYMRILFFPNRIGFKKSSKNLTTILQQAWLVLVSNELLKTLSFELWVVSSWLGEVFLVVLVAQVHVFEFWFLSAGPKKP